MPATEIRNCSIVKKISKEEVWRESLKRNETWNLDWQKKRIWCVL